MQPAKNNAKSLKTLEGIGHTTQSLRSWTSDCAAMVAATGLIDRRRGDFLGDRQEVLGPFPLGPFQLAAARFPVA